MGKQAHTPGPWAQSHREGPDGGYRTQVYPDADPDNTIATLHWHSVETDTGFTTDRAENARLIASAPDMLEALQQLIIEYDEVDLAEAEPASFTAAVISARAAIARATGGAA